MGGALTQAMLGTILPTPIQDNFLNKLPDDFLKLSIILQKWIQDC